MNHKINLQEFFTKGIFVIPEYQRGYKWSVKESSVKESSLEYFIKSLKNAYRDWPNEYFIEAVTVVEENGEIILVDGQQRTTSLFLLFAVIKDFEFIKNKLKYDVRKDSHIWLNNLVPDQNELIDDEDVQDIFYFKKAIDQINEILKNCGNSEQFDQKAFSDFIKKKVFLLYNVIPKEKAVNTFIALNGLKAKMKDEELIKSDLLIKSSRKEIQIESNIEDKFGKEWKINEDRGRLSRNWDKWLYWWNQNEVKEYFGTGNHHPLYFLLVTYWNINQKEDSKEFSFESFKSTFISNQKEAKLHFEGLRKLQKTFEDLYNNYSKYNFLGLILKTSHTREEALLYFLGSKLGNKLDLEEYAKWSLVRATHLEISENSTEKIKNQETGEESVVETKIRKAEDAINLINEKYVYWNENDEEFNDGRKEYAFRFLLLLNLLEDNKLERKFNFSVWNNRSLEHIFPKSKQNLLDFKNEHTQGSVHCIGNLVLLYGNNNSEFGAKDFSAKKITYFNTSESFQSRNLLHTISVFAQSKWEEKEICKNQKATIKKLKEYYGIKN